MHRCDDETGPVCGPTPELRQRSEAWLLRERLKELDCLYSISRLFERDGQRLDDTLRAVVELLPRAWQHEGIAGARIELRGRYHATDDFRETLWEQTCPIVVLGETAGWVTIAYREERPECDEGPFLAEERSLLNAVAQRLGGLIEREEARRQLLAHQHDLRSLAAQLARTEQQERRHIAELLHDRIGQALALLSIRLGEARASTEDPRLRKLLTETQEMAGQVLAETRFLTFELCPPILYELGLFQAVDWLGEQFQERHELTVRVSQTGEVQNISEQLRSMLFQAIRELLTNVVKHAGAAEATIALSGDTDRILVAVTDDGAGVPDLDGRITEHGGFGLFNIRERLSFLGGRMHVRSGLGTGTTVTLEVPRHA